MRDILAMEEIHIGSFILILWKSLGKFRVWVLVNLFSMVNRIILISDMRENLFVDSRCLHLTRSTIIAYNKMLDDIIRFKNWYKIYFSVKFQYCRLFYITKEFGASYVFWILTKFIIKFLEPRLISWVTMIFNQFFNTSSNLERLLKATVNVNTAFGVDVLGQA